MGHRELRAVDPRASLLKPMAVELCEDAESKHLLATLVAVEAACQRHSRLIRPRARYTGRFVGTRNKPAA